MLANFFGKSKPVNFIIIIGLFFCCFLVASFMSITVTGFSGDYLLKLTGVFLLFLSIFLFFHFIVAKNSLTYDNSYAFLFFTLFLILFLNYFLELKSLIIFLLYLVFLRKTYSLQSLNFVFKKLFNAGFWLGVLFVLEPFSIVFVSLLYVAIFLHKKTTIRTLLIPIIGFISPLIIYFTYCFWYNETENFLDLFYFFTNFDVSIYGQNQFLTPVLLIAFGIIASIFLKTPKIVSVNNTFRRSWVLVVFNLFISISYIIILPTVNGSEILFFLFPASIIMANGLELIKKDLIKNSLLAVFLIFALLFPFIA